MPSTGSGSNPTRAAQPQRSTRPPSRLQNAVSHSCVANPISEAGGITTAIATRCLWLLLALALAVTTACGGQSAPQPGALGRAAGTPVASGPAFSNQAARQPRVTVTPIATAPIFVNPTSRQPVWPTPPVWCRTSSLVGQRPDLGPTMGEFPVWLASRVLPVVPYRNELVRTVWVVDRSVAGDLVLSGRQTDGPTAPEFIREGGSSPTSQLIVTSAPRVGSQTGSPTAARYADISVYLSVPQPGCYELTARIGEYSQAYTVYVYN